MPTTTQHDRLLADQVLEVARHQFRDCPIRFGRTHKVDMRFEGSARDIVWKGPCKRRGGGFIIVCDYRHLQLQEHRVVLKQMLEDYANHVLGLKSEKVTPIQKRRKAFDICRNTAVNSTNDLELLVGEVWMSLGDYMPTRVRELQVDAVAAWLATTSCTGAIRRPPRPQPQLPAPLVAVPPPCRPPARPVLAPQQDPDDDSNCWYTAATPPELALPSDFETLLLANHSRPSVGLYTATHLSAGQTEISCRARRLHPTQARRPRTTPYPLPTPRPRPVQEHTPTPLVDTTLSRAEDLLLKLRMAFQAPTTSPSGVDPTTSTGAALSLDLVRQTILTALAANAAGTTTLTTRSSSSLVLTKTSSTTVQCHSGTY
jgi:hypothetical protein